MRSESIEYADQQQQIADTAKYHCKAGGDGGLCTYTSKIQARARRRLSDLTDHIIS